jgi:hypothetical protein
MKRNLKKVWPAAAASLVAFTSLSFADADNSQVRNLENRVTALEQRKGASGVVNPPGRPQVRNGADLFVTADLLWWVAHEDGIPLYIENEDQAFIPNLNNAEAKGLDWDWDLGFRVGLGYNTPHDGWDLSLTWMRVYGKAHQHGHVDSDDAIWPSLTHPAGNLNGAALGFGPFTKSHSHWHLQLNQLDFDLGREFFVSKWLTLRPYFGLRSDWIHQKLEVHYNRFNGNSGQDYEVELRNHFWGIGLATGLDTQWGLGGGWSIYGNAAFAILYGIHDLDRDDELSNLDEFKFVNMDDTYRVSRTVGDLQLGLRWDTMFDGDRFHFGIQAGWEHHVYFGQNQFARFVDDQAIGNFLANQGDLSFQGWTLSARFDF